MTNLHKLKNPPISTLECLQLSVVNELNIYNQAHLELTRPPVQTTILHEITKYEEGIEFDLNGELSGRIICLIDTYDKRAPKSESNFLLSLFSESMNILLGKLLTNLEERTDTLAMISPPKAISKKTNFNNHLAKDLIPLKLSLGYKLIYNQEELDCRVIILGKKQKIKEV